MPPLTEVAVPLTVAVNESVLPEPTAALPRTLTLASAVGATGPALTVGELVAQ